MVEQRQLWPNKIFVNWSLNSAKRTPLKCMNALEDKLNLIKQQCRWMVRNYKKKTLPWTITTLFHFAVYSCFGKLYTRTVFYTEMMVWKKIYIFYKMPFVPTNLPQCRPIEDIFGGLSSVVYEKGWKTKCTKQVKTRIRKSLKWIGLGGVKNFAKYTKNRRSLTI